MRPQVPVVSKSCFLLAIAVLAAPVVSAANLLPATIECWDDYVRQADMRLQQRLQPSTPFLWLDENPVRAARVRSGEMIVFPAAPRMPHKVTNGLIHDWVGASFIPNATIQDALAVVRDYGRYKDFYQPNVIDSKPGSNDGAADHFSVVLMNKAIFEKIALDSDYQASYTHLDDHRLYGLSRTTHIREIAGYGTATQHTLPEDTGTGLIWRLFSVIRFEERDGGLYMEVEAIVLSRDIPAGLHWVVDPIVRRVSKDALLMALKQTRDAVRMLPASQAAHLPSQ